MQHIGSRAPALRGILIVGAVGLLLLLVAFGASGGLSGGAVHTTPLHRGTDSGQLALPPTATPAATPTPTPAAAPPAVHGKGHGDGQPASAQGGDGD